jgi:hypothetical protein
VNYGLQEHDQRVEPGSADVGGDSEGERDVPQRVEVRLVHAPMDPREVQQKAVDDGHGKRIAREQRRQAGGQFGRRIVSVLADVLYDQLVEVGQQGAPLQVAAVGVGVVLR